MAKYQLSVVAPAVTTGAVLATIQAGANRVRVKRIQVVATTAVASSIGVTRASATGTPTAPVLLQPLQVADAPSLTSVPIAWSVAPTVPATPPFIDRATLGAVIGNGAVMSFPDELYIEPNTALALVNFGIATSGGVQVTVTIEE